MFSIKRFFDPDPVETPFSTGSQPSIAELMAKQGVKNEGETMVATPIVIQPKQEEPKVIEPTPPVATTNGEQQKPITPAEAPKQPEEPKEEVTQPQIVEQPTPQVSWQEVLKQQPDAVFKELGFDDKVVSLAKELNGFEKLDYFLGLVNEWKTTGSIEKYVKELSADYSKMPAEEVMRHQLRQEYPKASDQALDALFKREIVKAYNLDSEYEAEAEEGKLLLEAKADKYRDAMIERQKQYITPKPPEVKAPEVDNTAQLIQQANEQYKQRVIEDSYTKDVFTNKRITLGQGEEQFNFPIDPQEIQGLLFDNGKWEESLFDKVSKNDGTIDYIPKTQHQLLISTVAKYGQKFFDEYAKHWKAIGAKSAIEPIESAKKPDASAPSASEVQPTTIAGMMARQGRLV